MAATSLRITSKAPLKSQHGTLLNLLIPSLSRSNTTAEGDRRVIPAPQFGTPLVSYLSSKPPEATSFLVYKTARMEMLRPSPPPSPPVDRYGGAPSPSALRLFLQRKREGRVSSPLASGDKLYVAVGRTPEKTLGLLRWTFRRFAPREIGLLHVHQPSPLIPTLLGKIPVNQANDELVSSYRRTEWETTKKILLNYMSYCQRSQVQATVILTETEQIQSGIVDLVAQHGIRRLIMGSTPDNCFKLKGSSSKAVFTAKNTPPFCEIWFISKGRHIWTREASECAEPLLPICRSYESDTGERFGLGPPNHTELMLNIEYSNLNSFMSADAQESRSLDHDQPNNTEVTPEDFKSNRNLYGPQELASLPDANSWPSSPSSFPPEIEDLSEQLKEVTEEVERSKKAAFTELVKRKQVEFEVAESLNRVKAFEASQQNETKTRKEIENLLRTTKLQREELVNERDKSMKELQNVIDTIVIFESRAREIALQRDEMAGELDLFQSSIEYLNLEKQNIQQLGGHDSSYFESLKSSNDSPSSSQADLVSFHNDSHNLREFTPSDLQAATFEFSESFKLRQLGHGCIYKGELLNRTVMIKKFHAHNIRGQMEFQQEVYVLSKLRHRHLMSLLGMCPEALSLIYDYMPNGTLQDLLCRTASTAVNWKIRTRITAELSSALLFLHTAKPEKIVHGDLKPENIFLDVDFKCKIGNFSTCQFVAEDAGYNSSFHGGKDSQGSFPYADPEYQRTNELTTKSDIYSLGIIVLQLLTGRTPAGSLAGEVRQALRSGGLSTILDPAAGEWPDEVARYLAEFGLECSKLNSQDRPDLTPEVVMGLEQLHLMKERPVPSFFLCPILQEIMQDPHVAADGFTYERRALQEWFDSGRDTSPMTNLKLKHLKLTPNHALRFAIQDWHSHH